MVMLAAKVHQIAEGDMQPAEAEQQFWTVKAPEGTPRNAPLNAIFWSHVARKLRPLAEVAVITKDSAWYAKYLVLYVDGLDVRVKELAFYELEQIDDVEEENAEFKVSWGGPSHHWRIIRKSDNEVIKVGFKTRSEAALHMHRNLKPAA